MFPLSLKRVVPFLAVLCSIASILGPRPTTKEIHTDPDHEKQRTISVSGEVVARKGFTEPSSNIVSTSEVNTFGVTPVSIVPELKKTSLSVAKNRADSVSQQTDTTCAILFVGLPRSFKSLVLPSITKNIIPYNPNCDYYIHTYNKTHEEPGRSGVGGDIDPTEIFLLEDAIHTLQNGAPNSIVKFLLETENEFMAARRELLYEMRTLKTGGRLAYIPKQSDFGISTVENVVKQWHSIQSAWQMMEQGEIAKRKNYTTVAVLRSDVLFVTPIKVQKYDEKSVTIPGFARWPVNDRMIYGDRNAVEIWANQRFSRINQHVLKYPWGIHPESFLRWTIFPAIQNASYSVMEHPTICFLRARPDHILWANDCSTTYAGSDWQGDFISVESPAIEATYRNADMKKLVERTLGRRCIEKCWKDTKRFLECPPNMSTSLGKKLASSCTPVHPAGVGAPVGAGSLLSRTPNVPNFVSRHRHSTCAILFVGLPKSFKSLVLPGINKNVIPYNPMCDYYIHVYNKTHESSSRSGKGGAIDPTEIFLLEDAIRTRGYRSENKTVKFLLETENEFMAARRKQLNEMWTLKTGDRLAYIPKRKDFGKATVTNVVMQWHSIQSAWQMMEQEEIAKRKNYTTVAVLRSDVLFVTPIKVQEYEEKSVIIPAFAKWPVNDRMIYGDRNAVEIWANQRFSRIKGHVMKYPWGIHPERFLNFTILPAIQNASYSVKEHPTICFLRARPQHILWANDCFTGLQREISAESLAIEAAYKDAKMKKLVERTLGRPCIAKCLSFTQKDLECPLHMSASEGKEAATSCSSVHSVGVGTPVVQGSVLSRALNVPNFVSPKRNSTCAILFVGLPRSFKSLVLPSITKNIIPYNPMCDYYIHAYNKTHEDSGRSGKGGDIDPTEIFLLDDAIRTFGYGAQNKTVKFVLETENEFMAARRKLLNEMWTLKTGDRLDYIPTQRDFGNTTVENVVKQWHSIQSAWQMMEQGEIEKSKNYTTVAVLRSDVFFFTPINVQEYEETSVTIPGFAKCPVNDRMIYGDRNAVEIWANQRFSRIKGHVMKYPWGIHPERFLNFTILPAIRNASYGVTEHPNICFLRARPGHILWANDCFNGLLQEKKSLVSPEIEAKYKEANIKKDVEKTLGRRCNGKNWNNRQRDLECPPKLSIGLEKGGKLADDGNTSKSPVEDAIAAQVAAFSERLSRQISGG